VVKNLNTMTLEQIQRWMQTAIMHPGGVVEGITEARKHIDVGPEDADKLLTRSQALTSLERLAIYGNAYYARLLECLREEFPALKHALGDELFDEFAVGYLQKYPSRSYTLIQLGADFARYLAETRPQAEEGGPEVTWPDFLIDLATLEWTFSQVFDGPGSEGQQLLDSRQLAAVSPADLPESRLVCVSCLKLLTLRYPVHGYFTAVRRKGTPELPEPAETYLAVTRRNYVVRHYELSRPAHVLLQALLAGETVGKSIELAAEAAGPDLEHLTSHLREWFEAWTAEGFFQGIQLPTTP
jgi:Putative DNA-binding domain